MSENLTTEQMQADIAFLLLRCKCAGSCSFTNDRWTGMSSNALVAFAYGGEQDCMPSDRSDYAACVRTFRRLPEHRRTPAVREALQAARNAYLKNNPDDASSLKRREKRREWQEWRKRKRKRTRRAPSWNDDRTSGAKA